MNLDCSVLELYLVTLFPSGSFFDGMIGAVCVLIRFRLICTQFWHFTVRSLVNTSVCLPLDHHTFWFAEWCTKGSQAIALKTTTNQTHLKCQALVHVLLILTLGNHSSFCMIVSFRTVQAILFWDILVRNGSKLLDLCSSGYNFRMTGPDTTKSPPLPMNIANCSVSNVPSLQSEVLHS